MTNCSGCSRIYLVRGAKNSGASNHAPSIAPRSVCLWGVCRQNMHRWLAHLSDFASYNHNVDADSTQAGSDCRLGLAISMPGKLLQHIGGPASSGSGSDGLAQVGRGLPK